MTSLIPKLLNVVIVRIKILGLFPKCYGTTNPSISLRLYPREHFDQAREDYESYVWAVTGR